MSMLTSRLRAAGCALVLAALAACGGGGGGADGSAPVPAGQPLGAATLSAPDAPPSGDSLIQLSVTAAGKGVVARVEWDFGDGQKDTTTALTVSHLFPAGEYTVKATLTGTAGDSTVATRKVVVLPAIPNVYIRSSRLSDSKVMTGAVLYLGADVIMSGRQPPDTYTYRWDLGDGTTSSQPSLAYAYSKPGSYTVKVVLTDPRGREFSATRDVEIAAVTPYPLLTSLGGAGFTDGGPMGLLPWSPALARRTDGTLLISGSGVVRTKAPNGGLVTLAGAKGLPGYNWDGRGGEARLSGEISKGSAVDPKGVLYLLDNGYLRSVTPEGVVHTLLDVAVDTVDGPLATARLGKVSGVTTVGDDVYLSDVSTVRRLRGGRLDLVAGSASEQVSRDGSGAEARFEPISALAADTRGRLWILESCRVLRRMDSDGRVATLANLPPGSGAGCRLAAGANGTMHAVVTGLWSQFAEDGSLVARRTLPKPIDSVQFVVDGDDLLYTTGSVVLGRARPDGVWTEIIGIEDRGDRYFPLYHPSINHSSLSAPAATSDGSLVVAADGDLRRLVFPGQTLETIARRQGQVDGPAIQASVSWVTRVAVGAQDQVAFVDGQAVRRRDPDGTITTLAGHATATGDADGPLGVSRFNNIRSLAVDPSGNVWLLDEKRVVRVSPSGQTTTMLRHDNWVATLVVGKDGLPVLGLDGAFYRMAADGSRTLVTGRPGGQGDLPDWNDYSTFQMAVHPDGSLWFLDYDARRSALFVRQLGADGRMKTHAQVRSDILYKASLFQDPYTLKMEASFLAFLPDGRPVVSSSYRTSFWILDGLGQ